MASWYPHNRANDDGTNLVPDMPGLSDFRTKPFEAMRTEQDQIWWLYWWVTRNMISKEDFDALKDRVAALEGSQAEQDRRLDDLQAQIDELRSMICALAQNALTYDVTRGVYAPSIAQARREYQYAVTLGLEVDEAATVTVAELATHTCREVSVFGRHSVLGLGPDTGAIAEQTGYTCYGFNPDEYVRKAELTLIDTDNLAAHEIMGVLTTDAASDYVDPAPLLRRYVTGDMVNTYVENGRDVVIVD